MKKYLIAYKILQLTRQQVYDNCHADFVNTDEVITETFLLDYCEKKRKRMLEERGKTTIYDDKYEVFVKPLAVTEVKGGI